MNKLTIEHIAPYLPYNLTYEVFNEHKEKKMYCRIVNLSIDEEHEITLIDEDDQYSAMIEELTPLLRPLSDLTKEIEHNGEKFVPVEWFEIGDDDNYSIEFDNGKSIAKYNTHFDIKFLPYEVVRQLMEWHFDVFNLIPQGLAIKTPQ